LRTLDLRLHRSVGPTLHVVWLWPGLGAVAGVLLALTLFFPAAWVSGSVGKASGQRVLLANAEGTLWNGSAVVVLTGGEGSRDTAALPGRLNWRLRPAWQRASPERSVGPTLLIQLEHSCCLRQPLQAAAYRERGVTVLRIDELDWQGPVALLRGLGTPWNTLGFEGDLRLKGREIQLKPGHQGGIALVGKIVFDAKSVSSRISTVRPLGSYRMAVDSSEREGLQLALSTQEGAALQLSGQGQMVGGQLRFEGSARAAPERREALGNVLNLIGNRNGPVALRILR